MTAPLPLGRVVATPGALNLLEKSGGHPFDYLAAEVVEEHSLPTPLTWIEHYPEHEGEIGEYSLVMFSTWEFQESCLGGVWRCRLGSPGWSPLRPEEVDVVIEAVGEQPTVSSLVRSRFKRPCSPT
jgi:hypothetical protein